MYRLYIRLLLNETCIKLEVISYFLLIRYYLLVWVIDGNSWVDRVANAKLSDGVL